MYDEKLIAETKRDLIAKGVEFCLATYVDVHGVPKAQDLPDRELREDGEWLRAVHRRRHGRNGLGRSAGGRVRRGARSRQHDHLAVGQALCVVCQRSLLPRRALCELLADSAQTRDRKANQYTFNIGVETEFYVFRKANCVLQANRRQQLSRHLPGLRRRSDLAVESASCIPWSGT